MTRESLICPGCSCLCDDLDVTLENGRIVSVANVCLWGAGKFLSTKKFRTKSPRGRLTAFQVRRRGRWQQVPYEGALEEAAALLAKARRPLIFGLTNSGVRAQEAALNLALGLKARLEPADLSFMAPFYKAVKAHGLFWAPLEVIRDEADTVLFWGANPIHSAPRHLVRYAVFARGRFTERGIEDRRVAAVDIYPTELNHFCRPFVQVQPGQELALAAGLTARLTGRSEETTTVSGASELADFLAQTAYGVMFLGRGVSYAPNRELVERLVALVAWLNRECPFALLPLPGDFNSAGLYHLLLRELGNPGAPDFGAGGEVASHITPVDFQEVDAILVSGADLWWFLPDEQVQDLKRRQVPLVVLSPFANRTTAQAAALFPVALEGVEADEEAYRLDGLPVPLKAPMSSPWPAAHRILADLALFC
jgi:formylmethanofuran dehydrogenase subunit B